LSCWIFFICFFHFFYYFSSIFYVLLAFICFCLFSFFKCFSFILKFIFFICFYFYSYLRLFSFHFFLVLFIRILVPLFNSLDFPFFYIFIFFIFIFLCHWFFCHLSFSIFYNACILNHFPIHVAFFRIFQKKTFFKFSKNAFFHSPLKKGGLCEYVSTAQ